LRACCAVDADDHFAGGPGAALCAESCWQVAQLEGDGDSRVQLLLADQGSQVPQLAAIGSDDEVHAAYVTAPAMTCVGFLCDGDQDPAAAQYRPGTGQGLTAYRVNHHIDITDLILEPAGIVDYFVSAEPGNEGAVSCGRRGGHPGAVCR